MRSALIGYGGCFAIAAIAVVASVLVANNISLPPGGG
jgi:hypothetical protein